MKTYSLDMPLPARVAPFIVLTLLTILPPIGIVRGNGPLPLAVLFLAVIGWNWWVALTIVYQVILHEDGSLEWVSLARRIKTAPEDLREIAPDRMGSVGFLMAKHSRGKVRLINQITGFHEVLAHIKGRNPAVVIRGC